MREHRIGTLRDFTVSHYPHIVAGDMTHLESLVAVTTMAVQNARNDPNVPRNKIADTVLADLQAVYAGKGLSNLTGRGSGEFWYGNQVDIDAGRRGATGFDERFIGGDDQIQHTIGGIIGSYRYPSILEALANNQERHNPPDLAINQVTFAIGNVLNNENIDLLPTLLEVYLQPNLGPLPPVADFVNQSKIPNRGYQRSTRGVENVVPDPKAVLDAPRGGHPLDPKDDPSFTPPQSERDLVGYRFGDLTIDQFSPRTVDVLDAIQRNAGVADLQITDRVPGLMSTDAVGELGPERAMNGETIQLSVADLPTEQRLAVLDAAIRAGVTGIDAEDGTLTLEFGPEAAQGERVQGPRRAVADQDSWVYESQDYKNFVAGATIFPENPAPPPAFEANERVDQAFDDVRRATVLPSESAAGASQSAQSSTAANQRVRQAFGDARRASVSPASQPSRSVSLTNPFAFTRPVESIRPAASFPPAPSRAPSRDVMVDQYRQRALQMTGRSATSQGALRPTAADFEQVRRASVPAQSPADRVSEVFERFSGQPANRAASGPLQASATGSFFSSPLMGPSIGPFRPTGAAPGPRSRLVRPSVAPVRTRPTKTPATRTTAAPWERQSGIDGSRAFGGKQPSTPNARSQGSFGGKGTGGSILDSIFGNPVNPWESQHGSRVYGGRDQPSTPNARSKSSKGSSGGSGSGGGCFITTAICQSSNLPDDCHELTTLRRFRDEVMRPDPAKQSDIARYYEIAPRIVAGVEASGRADAIWADTRTHYLDPAIAHIQAGDHDQAYTTYRRMVTDLSVFSEA